MLNALLVRTVSVLVILLASGCSTGMGIVKEAYYLNPEYKPLHADYKPKEDVASLALSAGESKKKKCSLFKKYRQSDVYVYEPENSTVTWRLRASLDVDYWEKSVEMNRVYLQFSMPLGNVKERTYDKKRKCRPLKAHGGYIGALLPSPEEEGKPLGSND